MKAFLLGALLFLSIYSAFANEYLIVHRYPNMNGGLFFKQDNSIQREESELFLVQNLQRVISLKSYRLVSNSNDLYNYLQDKSYSHDVYKTNLTKKEVNLFLSKIKNSGYSHIFLTLQRALVRTRYIFEDEKEKEFTENFNRYRFSPKYLKELLDYGDLLIPNVFYSEKLFEIHYCQYNECDADKEIILDEDIDNLIIDLHDITKEIEASNRDYVNEGLRERLSFIGEKFLDYEKTFLIKRDTDRLKKMWQKFMKQIPNNYMVFRNLEEGSIDNRPPYGWLSGVINQYKDFVSKKEYKRLLKNFDTGFDHVGNGLGSAFVNVLGRLFKKRDWVPSIRLATNFRDNYLFSDVDKVIDTLLSDNGMKPGDIILEKDRKANTDILIPGYWVHASIYLGTIKDFKKLGVWDHPDFRKMRRQILKYNNEWRDKLDDEYKNSRRFEDVPWFSESDRPGVGVHPLNKFLQTDGMAVIRPKKSIDANYVKKIILKSALYLGMPYDYTHNIKNNRAMTCSKYVLKVFDDLTFNTSVNGPYTTVSPDQIGQIVDSSQASLIMFFEAENEGQLIYSADQKDENAYQVYLNNLY